MDHREYGIIVMTVFCYFLDIIIYLPVCSVRETSTGIKKLFTLQCMLFRTTYFIIPNLEDRLDSGALLVDAWAALLFSL